MKAVLVELFAKANYNNVDDGKRIIYRGQLKTTYDDLCSCTGLSKKVVRNRIEQFCRSGMITINSIQLLIGQIYLSDSLLRIRYKLYYHNTNLY